MSSDHGTPEHAGAIEARPADPAGAPDWIAIAAAKFGIRVPERAEDDWIAIAARKFGIRLPRATTGGTKS